jgi:hypothetical protein
MVLDQAGAQTVLRAAQESAVEFEVVANKGKESAENIKVR